MATEATSVELQRILVYIMDKVNLLTTALDTVYVFNIDERGREEMIIRDPENIDAENVEYVKKFLLIFRQYELFIR